VSVLYVGVYYMHLSYSCSCVSQCASVNVCAGGYRVDGSSSESMTDEGVHAWFPCLQCMAHRHTLDHFYKTRRQFGSM
jgi:hypothetical protein